MAKTGAMPRDFIKKIKKNHGKGGIMRSRPKGLKWASYVKKRLVSYMYLTVASSMHLFSLLVNLE